jgi:hypothetical protein
MADFNINILCNCLKWCPRKVKIHSTCCAKKSVSRESMDEKVCKSALHAIEKNPGKNYGETTPGSRIK